MEYFIIYYIAVADNFHNFLSSIIAVLGFVCFTLIFVGVMLDTEFINWKPWAISSFVLVSLFGVVKGVLPNSEQAAVIAGGIGVYEVVTSDEAKELGSNVINYANTYLETKTKEMKGETNEIK